MLLVNGQCQKQSCWGLTGTLTWDVGSSGKSLTHCTQKTIIRKLARTNLEYSMSGFSYSWDSDWNKQNVLGTRQCGDILMEPLGTGLLFLMKFNEVVYYNLYLFICTLCALIKCILGYKICNGIQLFLYLISIGVKSWQCKIIACICKTREMFVQYIISTRRSKKWVDVKSTGRQELHWHSCCVPGSTTFND